MTIVLLTIALCLIAVAIKETISAKSVLNAENTISKEKQGH